MQDKINCKEKGQSFGTFWGLTKVNTGDNLKQDCRRWKNKDNSFLLKMTENMFNEHIFCSCLVTSCLTHPY